MLLKCCPEYASKVGKLSTGHRTGKFGFHSNPKERQCQAMFKLPHNCTHLTCQQDYAPNLQARLQQYMDPELSDVQAGFRKGRRTRGQIANICWIIEKAKEFQNKKSASLITLKPLTVWITTNCANSSSDGTIRPPFLSPEKPVCRTRSTSQNGHGTMNWFKIGKGVCQGCILSPCLFNLHAEYIMRNPGLEEAQAGISIAGRNINNLRYVDDTTLMAESEEELKSLLMKVKEESENVGLKLNSQKTKVMPSSPITSWQIDGEIMEIVSDFIFLGL